MQPRKIGHSKTREINRIDKNTSQDRYRDSSPTRQFTDMSTLVIPEGVLRWI